MTRTWGAGLRLAEFCTTQSQLYVIDVIYVIDG